VHKEYRFTVTGGFDIPETLTEEVTHMGGIRGFKLPDGRIVTPIVALEIEIDEGMSYEYVTSEDEMAKLGFEGLDYDQLEFGFTGNTFNR
jgi:hypothetical protein